MKNFLIFITFLLIVNCTNNNIVYWCGDHPCINKKEKEAYFKKTMIVEIKDLNKKNYKDKSDIEKLMQQAKINEKERIKDEKDLVKQAKLEEKERIKKEKQLAKQAKLEEKRKLKEEKKLAKQAKLDQKNQMKEKKDLEKEIKLEEEKLAKDEKKLFKKKKSIKPKEIQQKSIESVASLGSDKVNKNKFSDLVEKIIKENSLRPYPDIDDIPK